MVSSKIIKGFFKNLKIITPFGNDLLVIHRGSTRIYRLPKDIFRQINSNSDFPGSVINDYHNLKNWGYLPDEKKQALYNQPEPTLGLRVSEVCNMKCRYCYNKENMLNKKKVKFMSKEIAERAIEYFLERNSDKQFRIVFGGGEPLLNFPLIKHSVDFLLKKKSKSQTINRITIVTNGTIMNKEILRFIYDKQIELIVALDLPPSNHNKNRFFKNNKSSFERVKKNILLLSKNTAPSMLIVKSVITRDSRFTLEQIYESFYKLNLPKQARFSFMGEMPCSLKPPEQWFSRGSGIVNKEIRRFNKKIRRQFLDGKISQRLERAVSDNWLKIIVEGRSPQLPCSIGVNSIDVNPLGDIYFCSKVVNIYEFYLGNVKTSINRKKLKGLTQKDPSFKNQCLFCWAESFCNGPTCYLFSRQCPELYYDKFMKMMCGFNKSFIIDSINFILSMNREQLSFFLSSLLKGDDTKVTKARIAVEIYNMLKKKNKYIKPVNIFPC